MASTAFGYGCALRFALLTFVREAAARSRSASAVGPAAARSRSCLEWLSGLAGPHAFAGGGRFGGRQRRLSGGGQGDAFA